MNFNYIATFFAFLLVNLTLFGQKKVTLSGYVRDATSGETLLGANIAFKEIGVGSTTNQYGYYSLTAEPGEYTLVISYIGYQSITKKINLTSDTKLNQELQPTAVLTNEIVITDERSNRNTESTQMGTIELSMEKVKKLPAFMGEVDVLKTVTLLPGVQSGGEGNTGLYVRGGGPDQNLILLDGATVYNASHLFGFFSVFNADAIKNVSLYKGNMPAQFGSRLSSVLDITMKEGNYKEFQAEGGIGLVASRLTVQGPILKDKVSFIVSGRRTYIDALVQPILQAPRFENIRGTGYFFYDLNAKINWQISDKDKLYLSGYFGRDVFTFINRESEFNVKIPWGNATGVLRWNHLFSSKLFSNVSLIYTNYDFAIGSTQNDFSFNLASGVKNITGKIDFNYYASPKHDIKFGAELTHHILTPTNATLETDVAVLGSEGILSLHGNEAAVYIGDDWEINKRLKINIGGRVSYFQQVGPFNRFIKDDFGQTVDTISYERGTNIADYLRAEPRFSARYKLNDLSSIKASYSQNYQYIHLARLATVSLPTDVWLPSTELIKPQFSQQVAIGYFRNFDDNNYEFSIEAYYKKMNNLVEFADGADPTQRINDNPDGVITQGRGEAYGAEFFVQKKTGKFTGWIGYTLAWSIRMFDDLNNGKPFFDTFDRRHDLSIALTYEYNKRWTFSTVFVYATGNTLTLPESLYFLEGKLVTEFGERNAFRFEPYHRWDLSATWLHKKTEKFNSSWNFSIYNVYSRLNPYFIYFRTEGSFVNGDFRLRARQVSLFPIIPSVTWNFKF